MHTMWLSIPDTAIIPYTARGHNATSKLLNNDQSPWPQAKAVHLAFHLFFVLLFQAPRPHCRRHKFTPLDIALPGNFSLQAYCVPQVQGPLTMRYHFKRAVVVLWGVVRQLRKKKKNEKRSELKRHKDET